jgi:hypothetical protein
MLNCGDFIRIHEPYEILRYGTIVQVDMEADGRKFMVRYETATINRLKRYLGRDPELFYWVDQRWCTMSSPLPPA